MTAPRTARLLVEAPAYTPLRYGLLTVAQQPDTPDDHWRAGLKFEPQSFAVASVTSDPCTGAPLSKTATQVGIVARGVDAFTVYAEIKCSPVGHWEDYLQRTEQALLNGEARAVENEFWTGAGGTMPHLAANAAVYDPSGELIQTAATDLSSGVALDISEAISVLEANLALCYGGEGVIHVPRLAFPQMYSELLVYNDGDKIRTQAGNLVAVGAGYPGTSPAGATPAAGNVYLYATGAISLRRSAVETTSTREAALNRTSNTMVLVSERTYSIAIDSTCHYAALVRAGGEVSGTVGTAT